MANDSQIYAALEARYHLLQKRLDALVKQRAALDDEEREIKAQQAVISDIMRTARSTSGTATSPALIQEPASPGVDQFDSIIKLLRANKEGLASLQVTDFLEPRIRSKAKNRRAVLSSALSTLRKQGDIELVGGLYRIAPKSSR
jgi:hypothetical protein